MPEILPAVHALQEIVNVLLLVLLVAVACFYKGRDFGAVAMCIAFIVLLVGVKVYLQARAGVAFP